MTALADSGDVPRQYVKASFPRSRWPEIKPRQHGRPSEKVHFQLKTAAGSVFAAAGAAASGAASEAVARSPSIRWRAMAATPIGWRPPASAGATRCCQGAAARLGARRHIDVAHLRVAAAHRGLTAGAAIPGAFKR